MAENNGGVDAWWVDCPFCDYEGPEPPIPGLEARPGHHEVWLCPSCRGALPLDFSEVVRAIAANEAARLAAKEAKDAEKDA